MAFSRFVQSSKGAGARNAWPAAAVLLLLASSGCKNDKCSDDELIALELHLNNPDELEISKVTAELEHGEVECGFFDQGMGHVYTCWEQGGGTYTVRIYVGDEVIYKEDDEVEADACHIKQLFVSEINLAGLGPAAPANPLAP